MQEQGTNEQRDTEGRVSEERAREKMRTSKRDMGWDKDRWRKDMGCKKEKKMTKVKNLTHVPKEQSGGDG